MSDHRKGEADSGEPFSEAEIDAALAESFPASDPPPWTLGVETNSPPENEENREEGNEGRVPNDCSSVSNSYRALLDK